MWFEYFLWLWRWQRSIHSIGVAVWARTMKTRRVETLKSFNLLLFKRQWNFLSTLEVCCFHADILPQTALCCLRIDAGHRIREVRHQYSSILHGSMIFIIPWKCYIFAYKLMFNNGTTNDVYKWIKIGKENDWKWICAVIRIIKFVSHSSKISIKNGFSALRNQNLPSPPALLKSYFLNLSRKLDGVGKPKSGLF